MKKSLLALALICSATGMLVSQSNMKNDHFDVSAINEMLDMHHGVVDVRIIDVELVWNEEHTLSYNHYTLEVLQSSKSNMPERITVVTESNSPTLCSVSDEFQLNKELRLCLASIPSEWECGYTPRYAYTALFTYAI